MLRGEKILITGPTGQVAFVLARELARHNRVHGLARFGRREDRQRIEALGVECLPVDLAGGSLDDVPRDYTIVLHFAVAKSGDFAYDLAANAEGAGRLMSHCRHARAFLHCSSAAVYEYSGGQPAKETDPLGDNHRALLPTYSLSKIAAETVVRLAAHHWQVPTTIVRQSVPYGSNGGWPWFHLLMMKRGHPIPIHPEAPNSYNPIHEDDYVAQIPRLLEIASVEATTLNGGGSDPVSIEDWCAYLGDLTGLEPRFHVTEKSIGSLPIDLTRMHERVGKTRVDWRDGLRRMVEAREPELLKPRAS